MIDCSWLTNNKVDIYIYIYIFFLRDFIFKKGTLFFIGYGRKVTVVLEMLIE